jgi:hypothetical protein
VFRTLQFFKLCECLPLPSQDEEDSLDTTAAQHRRGKDIQGIPWERMHFTREKYRETRLQQYKNYENLDVAHEELQKVCANEELVTLRPYLPTALQSDSFKIPGQQVSLLARNGGEVDCMHEKLSEVYVVRTFAWHFQRRLHRKISRCAK